MKRVGKIFLPVRRASVSVADIFPLDARVHKRNSANG